MNPGDPDAEPGEEPVEGATAPLVRLVEHKADGRRLTRYQRGGAPDR